MNVLINYKFFIILFSMLFFIFLLFISCKDKVTRDEYPFLENENIEPVHTDTFSYEENYDPKNKDTLTLRLSSLLSTQLHYTQIASTKSDNQKVREFATTILVEYKNALIEMESLVHKDKQDRILHSSSQRFVIDQLELQDPTDYDSLFLDETIKLQFSIRQVLLDLKNNTKDSDLQAFYNKLIQEIELRIDQGVNLLDHV